MAYLCHLRRAKLDRDIATNGILAPEVHEGVAHYHFGGIV